MHVEDGIEAVILGCTELPLFNHSNDTDELCGMGILLQRISTWMVDSIKPIRGGSFVLSFLWIVEEQLSIGWSDRPVLFNSHNKWNIEFWGEEVNLV